MQADLLENAGPGRRSTEDLQRILESLMGDRDVVLSAEVPELLLQYKEKHGVSILDEDEFENAKVHCIQHGEMELSSDSLFTFLSIMTQADKVHMPNLTTSASMPNTSLAQLADSTPKAQRRATHRRISDRVRSPSDSSSSEDDLPTSYSHPDSLGIGRPRNERHVSAPPESSSTGGTTFPSSTSHLQLASLGQGRPGDVPRRKHTLSDPSRHECSASARAGRRSANAPPPSAFGMGFGSQGGFARPSPASRRRRGSASGHSASGDREGEEGMRSPDGVGDSGSTYQSFASQQQQQMRRRSSSALSHHSLSLGGAAHSIAVGADANAVGSIVLQDGSTPSSPLSPNFGGGVDGRSFNAYNRAKSPDEMSDMMPLDIRDHDEYGFSAGTGAGAGGERGEVDDVEGDVDEMGDGLVGARLGRLATESSASLRTSHDKLRLLQKQNTELARKLKESERQLSSLGAENERLVEDLQERLEEAREELAQRRKDEKEWRGKDRTQTIQISGFEAEIQSLQRTLEHSRASYANMQKMYNSQCDEAQRLRDNLLDREFEIRNLQSAAETHAADEDKSAREIEALEAAISHLNTDLSSARSAESYLETQKQENLQLKETIDRMRYELDEARSAVMSGGHTRGTTGTMGSVPGTLSRNLGDEIQRRLTDMQRRQDQEGEGKVVEHDEVIEEEEEVEEGDSYEETVITTQRTRRVGRSNKGKQPESVIAAGPADAEGTGSTVIRTAEGPIIRIEDGVKEFADASVGTEPVIVLPANEDDPSSSTPTTAEGTASAAAATDADGDAQTAPAEGPPAYTRHPPLDPQRILDDAHPREPLDPGITASSSSSSISHHDLDPAYEDLVEEVGMRCVVLEAEMKRKAGERRKLGLPSGRRARSRTASGVGSGSGVTVYLNQMSDKMSANTLVVGAGIAGAALVAGFAIGWSLNVPMPMREHDLYAAMNSLVLASAAGEGMVPAYGRALWYSMGGAGNVLATRIPS